MERGVEGAVLDVEVVLGGGPDPAGDGVAVPGAPGEGLEDQDVEGALEEIELWSRHESPLNGSGEILRGDALTSRGWDLGSGGWRKTLCTNGCLLAAE
jgi:hypothetical protein